ncbi:hypothetical protein D3C85_1826560 [compost metagenome]
MLIAFVSASPAALLTEVGSEEAGGVLAAEVVIFTIDPLPAAFMWGIAYREQ